MDDKDSHSIASSSSQRRPRRPTRDLPPEPPPANDANSAQITGAASESPIVDEPEQDDATSESARKLTPIRAHYLKKTLIALQVNREVEAITTAPSVPNLSTLSYLGPPFSSPPRDAPSLDLPILRYIFRQFFLSFPFLSTAPKNFYAEKLQPFIASVLSRNLVEDNALEEPSQDPETDARKRLISKMEKHFSLLMSSATKLVEPEEVVRLTQADLNRLEGLARKRNARMVRNQTVFEVNIVCIRAIVVKGRVRSKVHEVSHRFRLLLICVHSCGIQLVFRSSS